MSPLQIQASSSRGRTILLVEDEALLRMTVADELRIAGFTVVECRSADEAFELVKAGGNFDLLLTDVQMPGARNGLDLAREVAALRPELPVIITSGNLAPSQAEQFDAFLPKPFPIDIAAALVKRLIAQGKSRTEETDP
jgi:two-component system, response regulator PdtaR